MTSGYSGTPLARKLSLKDGMRVWRNVIRAVALPMHLVDVKVCSVDDIWSDLKLVVRKEHR